MSDWEDLAELSQNGWLATVRPSTSALAAMDKMLNSMCTPGFVVDPRLAVDRSHARWQVAASLDAQSCRLSVKGA